MARSVSRKELVRRFRALGYTGPFSGGRHQFMMKGSQKIRIPNLHGRGEIGVSLLNEILRQGNIEEEEWNKV
ncbi:TPA: hypothetical protein DCY67_03800 [Candidatus Acetothermia bacterium]|nr:hypothetical protein [Candidatus Acetothermia bacterium]